MNKLSQDRIRRGQCPACGKEAAPYYLCHDCRFKGRLTRTLNRGAKVGALAKEKRSDAVYFNLPKNPPAKTAKWGSTPLHLPESDARSHPRLRGIRVDVEATLIEVIRFIGRPCTIEEILAGWGSLRSKRDAPLANDLARIIAAQDKRARRGLKLSKSRSTSAAPDATGATLG